MLDFPASPSVGERYPEPPQPGVAVWEWDGTRWLDQWIAGGPGGGGGGGGGADIGDQEPDNPRDGQFWFDTDSDELKIWDDTQGVWTVVGGLADAPQDGVLYGRMDGAWEPVEWILDGGTY